MNVRSIGILGYGESRYVKRTEEGVIRFLAEASRLTLKSAGLAKTEVDGLAVCSFELPPDNAVTLAEQFGISISWAYLGTAGGAGPVASLINAVRAIETGQANIVLCVAGDAYDVAGHFKLMDNFNRALMNYAVPNGFGGANGLFAIIQRKHMEMYGTTRERLGRISVDQRFNARLNENALLRGPLTLADYLEARMIADPLRLYDCVLPCAGAGAVVVGPLDRAPEGKGIRVLSGFEHHNYPPGEVAPLTGGWVLYRDRLYGEAGYGSDEMNFVQFYDDYPIMCAIQFEALGFCQQGEVEAFLGGHDFTYQGDLPLNTGGGQLSCGQAGAGGGIIGLVEAVRQLRLEAGPRQVRNVTRGLVSGYGMVGYGHGLSTSSVILERAI